MSFIERLPYDVAEEILGITLGLVESDNIIRSRQTVVPSCPHAKLSEQDRATRESTQKLRAVALPLLLSCKTLSSITSAVIFARSLFFSPNDLTLAWFLDSLEKSKLLSETKHFSVVLYSNSKYNVDLIDTSDDATNEVIAVGTRLLSRLPQDLLSLELAPPYDQWWPPYSDYTKVHPLLTDALGRYPYLRDLRIDFLNNWLHLELFCAAANSFRMWPSEQGPMVDPNKGDVSPHPRFPELRHLYLRGSIIEGVPPEHIVKAFSEEQLPRLQSLHLDGVLYNFPIFAGYDGPKVCFTSEVLLAMAPLREFMWRNYDFDNERNSRKADGDTHAPPMTDHLEALKTRHGETLRYLILDYKGWEKHYWAQWDLTKEYLTSFVESLNLKHVMIRAPQIGVEIS